MDENNKIITLGTLSTYNEKKQDLLVSEVNIKTINGQSIIGSGKLEISGGDSSEFATEEDIMELFG